MSEEAYNDKLKSVQRFIPFLENMIEQLKDPKMKNREQQLNKMESLYGMITDKKKKLKVETLNKCEDVIVKLYQKVKGDSPLPPLPGAEPERTDHRRTSGIYEAAGESLERKKSKEESPKSKLERPKSFFLTRPPISNADLERLEKDVASELTRNMSLQELNSLKNKLFQQLEEFDDINTTVRNKPVLTKLSPSTSDKSKKTGESRRNSAEKKPSESAAPKILKESGDIFGNAFSELDRKYEQGAKKREERKTSVGKDKGETGGKNDDQLKHLAEKAAELRNKNLPVGIAQAFFKKDATPSFGIKPFKIASQKPPVVLAVPGEEEAGKIPEETKNPSDIPEEKRDLPEDKRDLPELKRDLPETKRDFPDVKIVDEMGLPKPNRDPRLKNLDADRLALKYKPKPKKQEVIDLEKDVADIIENDMKHSTVSLPPPAQLKAPPIPPTNLFSPESPEEMDRAPVPAIVNNILLNPNISGVVNEVVNAMKRSANDMSLPPQPSFVPPPENPMFMPQNPPMSACRGFNPFVEEEAPVLDFQPPGLDFQPPPRIGSITPYEDRMSQGFHLDRALNFVPPTPAYQIPPSPSYQIPPSPLYDGGDNFANFHAVPNQGFYERNEAPRPSLLGDYGKPRPLFNNFYNNQMYETQNNFYGPSSRDPRVFGNRQFQNDPRVRDSRMTYREYKEQKERENRQREERENRERDLAERQRKEKEEAERLERIAKEKEAERERERKVDSYKSRDRDYRYRREREERPRYGESRFDKAYSNREKDKEDFMSPLDSLYTPSTSKTGKGYGLQFKIPKKVREETKKEEEKEGKNKDDKEGKNKDEKEVKKNEEPKIVEKEGKRREDPRLVEKEGRRREDPRRVEKDSRKKEDPREVEKEGRKKEDPKEAEKDRKKKEDPRVSEKDRRKKENSKVVEKDSKNKEESSKLDKEENTKLVEMEDSRIVEKEIKRKDDPKEVDKDDKKQGGDSRPIEEETKKKSKAPVEKETRKKEEVEIDKKNKEEEEAENVKVAELAENDTEKIEIEESVAEEIPEVEAPAPEKAQEEVKPPEPKEPEPVKKNEEENILSRFFQNLMKSTNHDEKKGALLSLISTFSDSFSDQQLKRITNIIKSEQDEEEDVKPPKLEVVDEKPKVLVEAKKEEIIEELQDVVEEEEEEETVPEKVQMSVAERTKSRKRVEPPKGKSKLKTELDRLHEDIREMFIRDGVVTASGKRMCRLLKYSTPEKEQKETETASEEPKKKKRGRKPVGFKKHTIEMRELSVVLPKISLEKVKEEVGQRYALRRPVKATNYTEMEEEEKVVKKEEEKMEKEEVKESEHEESTEESASPEDTKKRGRKKTRKAWASGVIKRKSSVKRKRDESSDADEKLENLHEASYYLKPDQSALQCKLCPVAKKWIAAHYRSEHPDSEVLSSRVPEETAKILIADSKVNRREYEEDAEESKLKHNYTCVFCDYDVFTVPRMYADHVTIHTGEFRYACPYCSFQRSHIKSMQGHLNDHHAKEMMVSKKCIIAEPASNKVNVYAYLCDVCNYVQIKRDNVEAHVKNYHKGKGKIFMIKCNKDVKEEGKVERSGRRSAKLPPEIDRRPSGSECEENDAELPPPELTKEVEEGGKVRAGRKRRKSVATPQGKKAKRKVEKVEEAPKKKIDEAVFTCNTDIQEENKQIEEERLKLMQDINSTIKLRTSLDFVEKLSNRLRHEEETVVKQEPPEEEQEDTASPNELPVFEKSKRETPLPRTESSPKTKDNPISGLVEKLQDKLSHPPALEADNAMMPPPLKHIDELDLKKRENNCKILNLGPMKVFKGEGMSPIYTCCSPPCIFSTRDRGVFRDHCRLSHAWNANLQEFPKCVECGFEFKPVETVSLLTCALQHAEEAHEEFIGSRIGRIRVSNNLFARKEVASPPTISIPSPPPVTEEAVVEQEPQEEEEKKEDDPYSFKIVNVVSLADPEVPPLALVHENQQEAPSTQMITYKNKEELLPPETSLEWMTGDTRVPIHPMKTQEAMKRFLLAHLDLFKCPEMSCVFTTKSRKMFEIHIKMHWNFVKKAFPCIYCNKRVMLEKMGDHYEHEHAMCRFSCYYCLYRCIVKDYMNVHQTLFHPNLPPRMQLLAKRDQEIDNKLMSILCDALTMTTLADYECCNMVFTHYNEFLEHVSSCPNVHKECTFQENGTKCGKRHSDEVQLGKHWGKEHHVNPLSCAYCKMGSFYISEMMIHQVLDHANVPPHVKDRTVKTDDKPKMAHCNFKMLVAELRNNMPKKPVSVTPAPSIVTAPVTLLPMTTGGISILKPTTKSNALASGGVVYCLAPNSPKKKNQMVKVVLNEADPTKVTLLSPVAIAPNAKLINNVTKVLPVPKLMPILPKVLADPEETDPEKSEENPMDVSDFEEPMMVIDESYVEKPLDDVADPLSLDVVQCPRTYPGKRGTVAETPLHEYDSDSKDVDAQEVGVTKTGLMGYQLYRCAVCELSFSDNVKFKDHLIKSTKCKVESATNKHYVCVHCGRGLKQIQNLLDHLGYHGHLRFLCSICNKTYPHGNQVRQHMKSKHNVTTVVMQPLVAEKNNMASDYFVVKPKNPIKEAVVAEVEGPKAEEVKTVFYSHEAEDIPQKSILGYDITCGHCKKFKNKVRSNIVRHLLLHKNDKDFTVPDTAPVNPVPCLEKNEKMFDKMYNLASSSHAGGRMGGQQKPDAKSVDKTVGDNHPAFIPSNKRYQCCAVGCNYLCLEEGNLRHHLSALHMEDLNFVCVHCKKDLSDAVDIDTIIKHLKLHDLHLYKCSHCDFMHNLRHKVERHFGEKHKNKESAVVVLRAMDSEPYDESHPVLAPFPVNMHQKSMKNWRCCMCKYRCYTEEEAATHASNKHDIDCRYKCALCTFRSNVMAELDAHFKEQHPSLTFDVILAYCRDTDSSEPTGEQEQFDTTPIWQRDKPRVRHIRGILFEENFPVKKKNTQGKTAETSPAAPAPQAAKKRRKSTNVTINNDVNEEVEIAKEAPPPPPAPPVEESDKVIVIDDDDDEEMNVQEVSKEEAKASEFDDIDLLCTYGDVGMPNHKHFQCPKCLTYRTTSMRDFVNHVAGEMQYYRYTCAPCDEYFVTADEAYDHCAKAHQQSNGVSELPIDRAFNRWLTVLLEKQSTFIKTLGFPVEDMPGDVDELFKSEAPKVGVKCTECDLDLFDQQALELHHRYNHPDLVLSEMSGGIVLPDVATLESSGAAKRPSEDVLDAQDAKRSKNDICAGMILKDMYVCKLCNAGFSSVPEMEYHAKEMHSGETNFSIQPTDMTLARYETGRNMYRCTVCATTGSKYSLNIHFEHDHPGLKMEVYRVKCGICSAHFESMKNLKKHYKVHGLTTLFYFDIYDKRMEVKTRNVGGPAPVVKLYNCPLCSYVSKSNTTTNIRSHLKIHAKPLECEICHARFKNRPDARVHHLKEHPHNSEMIIQREDMVEKVNSLMFQVLKNAQVYLGSNEEAEEVVVEVELPQLETPKNHYAKKSTSSPVKRDETKEWYSFYGTKSAPLDLKKITTKYAIDDTYMRMTCEQLGKIHNLNPVLRLRDCMTLIIDEEDDDDSMSS